MQGSFNFVHSATTSGSDPSAEFFLLVPGSGTRGLAGITGTGGLRVDDDGTHRIWLDYEPHLRPERHGARRVPDTMPDRDWLAPSRYSVRPTRPTADASAAARPAGPR